MKTILRLSCSPRAQASESFRLSEAIVDRLLQRYPEAQRRERQLINGTISHVDPVYAAVLGGMHATTADDAARGALAESERLIRELEECDCLVIATPMHNYSIPSALKAWVDHIVRIHRTFRPTPQGKAGMLRDRPVFVAVSAGGMYSDQAGRVGSSPRQPDFLTPYLTAVLNTIGLHDITFFSVEGAAFGSEALARGRATAAARMDDHFSSVTA